MTMIRSQSLPILSSSVVAKPKDAIETNDSEKSATANPRRRSFSSSQLPPDDEIQVRFLMKTTHPDQATDYSSISTHAGLATNDDDDDDDDDGDDSLTANHMKDSMSKDEDLVSSHYDRPGEQKQQPELPLSEGADNQPNRSEENTKDIIINDSDSNTGKSIKESTSDDPGVKVPALPTPSATLPSIPSSLQESSAITGFNDNKCDENRSIAILRPRPASPDVGAATNANRRSIFGHRAQPVNSPPRPIREQPPRRKQRQLSPPRQLLSPPQSPLRNHHGLWTTASPEPSGHRLVSSVSPSTMALSARRDKSIDKKAIFGKDINFDFEVEPDNISKTQAGFESLFLPQLGKPEQVSDHPTSLPAFPQGTRKEDDERPDATTRIPNAALAPRRKGHVSFSKLTIREYGIELGDNPCCSSGPPVSLGWRYEERGEVLVEEYEQVRTNDYPRRALPEMLMSHEHRRRVLLRTGYSQSDIQDAEQEVNRIKTERGFTEFFMLANRVDEVVTDVLAGIRNILSSKQPSKEKVD